MPHTLGVRLLDLGEREPEDAVAADDGGRRDRAPLRLVVERDVARDDRYAERVGRDRDRLDRLAELPRDLGLLGVAEVEAVGQRERRAAGTRDVAARVKDRLQP